MAKLGSLELKGASGRSYEFEVHPRGDPFKPLAAVYFFAKRIPFAEHEAEYTWICVGETTDLSRRPLDVGRKPCIDKLEANCVCLLMENDGGARKAAVLDLRAAYAPPCNEPEPVAAVSEEP